MKKKLLLVALLGILVATSFAQRGGGARSMGDTFIATLNKLVFGEPGVSGNVSLQKTAANRLSVVGSDNKVHATFQGNNDTITLGATGDASLTEVTTGIAMGGDANGQLITLRDISELTTIAAAATTDTTIQIPANAIVVAVSTRVTVQPPGTTTYSVGVSGATTRYGNAISSVATTTGPGTLDALRYYSSAVAIRFTPNASPSDNTGRIRVTIHYIEVTAPTS